MSDKRLHPGSNLQLAPACDHCSNALPTELPVATVDKLTGKFSQLSQTDNVLLEFYWNFPFKIFNDMLFQIPTRD